MAADNREPVAQALTALGQAWRMDWSDFDGRTLRHQLDELALALKADEPFNVAIWYAASGIDPETNEWK